MVCAIWIWSLRWSSFREYEPDFVYILIGKTIIEGSSGHLAWNCRFLRIRAVFALTWKGMISFLYYLGCICGVNTGR